MKKFIRNILINSLSLQLTAIIFPGLVLEGGLWPLLVAGAGLTLINRFVKPVIKLLLLPINLLTLGLFRWLVSVLSLLVLTFFLPQVKIQAYQFSGASYAGFTVPAINFSAFLSYIVVSVLLSTARSFILWIKS